MRRIGRKFLAHNKATPSVKAKSHIDLEAKYGCHNYGPLPVVISRGQGPYVWDVDGNKYFDFISGIASLNQGHCHPQILKVAIDQLQHVHQLSRALYSDKLADCQVLLHNTFGYDKSVLMSTGFEAAETAVKFARRWGYNVKKVPDNQARVVFAKGNFWGRGLTACGSSDDPIRYDRFGPFNGLNFDLVDFNDAEALEQHFIKNPYTVAFMVEPIQGEKGIVYPKEGYLKKVSEICKKHQVLLIADEIQVGLGRTGKLLCHYWDEIRPDMVVLGKSLSGGVYPVSAVLADNEIMDQIKPGEHGSTWGGNPLAAAVAKAGLEVILKENLSENSLKLGNIFYSELNRIFGSKSWVKEIRGGRGLYAGIQLTQDMPYSRVVNNLQKNMLLTYGKGDVIRLIPPLILTESELSQALENFEDGIQDL